MHRLFWKLFLSYWAALVLFAGAVMMSASLYLDHLHERQELEAPYAKFTRHLAEARAAAEHGGADGLIDWARRVDRHELVPMLLIDTEGRELLGREVSTRITAYLERRQRRSHRDRSREFDRSVSIPGGSDYRLVEDFQSVTLGRLLGRPRVLALPLIIAALAGGLMCLLLARYLVAPIERLRLATEDFASGNFQSRVSPALGRRRDEIADLGGALDHMAERLDNLLSSQTRLLRDVSHELRSPLARLQAALALARRKTTGDTDSSFDRIELEAERLNDLIGRILSLSRLDAGMEHRIREPVGLGELIQGIAEDAEIEAQTKGCTIRLALSTEGRLVGDPVMLASAVENVLRNAIRYSPPDSEIHIELTEDPISKTFQIRVRDQGPGVPAGMLERIFEPFVRIDDDPARRGHGLGLAIARRAIHAHGGSVHASNHAEGGLEVRIELPA